MERVTLRLPESEVRRIETLVECGYSPNRSDAIREFVSRYVDEAGEKPEVVDSIANAYIEDRVSFDELAEVVGAERAKRIDEKTDSD